MSTANENRHRNMRVALQSEKVYPYAEKCPKSEVESLWTSNWYDGRLTVEPDEQDMKFHSFATAGKGLWLIFFAPLAVFVTSFAAWYYKSVENVRWSDKSVWGDDVYEGFLLRLGSGMALILYSLSTYELFKNSNVLLGIVLVVLFLVMQALFVRVLWRKVITKLVVI